MSETGERANIDLEWMIGLGGRLRESQSGSLLGDPSLLGEDSSRIGSQIDRRCCPIAAVPPRAELGPPPGSILPPSDSRPIADELLSASAQNTRPRSSATPDQRACIVPPLSLRCQPSSYVSFRFAVRDLVSGLRDRSGEQ